ncbi:MAG: hypothetical protein IBX68_12750 [Dehalococcoidia bacterium]|nr:hypothetical protein [Dehalococcoidia bacterium]
MIAKKKPGGSPDWDDLMSQADALRLERISPEERLEKAKRLADVFRKHGRPLPSCLAALV